MKKLKIYLDTSVISYLKQEDTPEKMEDTQLLWKDIKADKYNILVSDVTFTEIDNCSEPKRTFMRECLAEIKYMYVLKNDESQRLSDLYFKFGGLPPKSKDDALHIAIATINDCDIILSWNFKHIVNLRAMTTVEAVNIKESYKLLRILSPSSLLEKEV